MPDWLVVVVRSVVFLLILFVITKILGKKQIAQLSMFEYVTGITIGNIGAEVVTGLDQKVHLGIIAIIATAAVPYISSQITLRSKIVRDFFDGKGTVIMQDGKIMEENLKKEKVTADEFLEMLRKNGVFDIAEVDYAVLEANGILNVLLKKENRPLTAKDLNMNIPKEKEPCTIIMDGVILDESFVRIGKNHAWLNNELAKMDVSLDNVFLGQVNSYGELTIDLFDDKVKVPQLKEKQLLYATMKKCQADLELLGLTIENDDKVRQTYLKNSRKMQEAIDKIAYILKS